MWRYLKSKQGLTLIELLISIVFLVTALVGFSYFLARGWGTISNLGSDRLAVEFVEMRLEELSGTEFHSLESNPLGSWLEETIDDHGTVDADDDLIGEYRWDVALEPTCVYSCKLITIALYYPSDPENDAPTPHQKVVRLAKIIDE